jgi:hypothetical protein
MESGSSRGLCKVLAGLSMAAGVLGMLLSYLYLSSASMADITAGASGFVAGAILIGSGLIALSLLASTETQHPGPSLQLPRHEPDDRITKEIHQ